MGQKVEQKWAKGLQQQGKGWSIGFQIKGKRQSMTVYCSQTEAAVVYDLAAIWANKQKGNNPENSTYYNFSILWYPREYIERMVQLPDFPSVKEYTAQLLADGTVQRLVPFDGVEHMHRIRPNDTWKTHRALDVGVNSRGIHFFSGSFWNCVLMEDVEAFGADGRCLQLAYRDHINILADRARQNALAVYHYKSTAAMHVYRALQQAVAAMEEQGIRHVPKDLANNIDPQPESAAADDSEDEGLGKPGGRRRATGPGNYAAVEANDYEEEFDQSETPTPVEATAGAHGMGGSYPWGMNGGLAMRPKEERYDIDEDGGSAEGPSKDELDLFKDFASIAAASGGSAAVVGGRQEGFPQTASEAAVGIGRRGGRGVRPLDDFLATAPARLPPVGRVGGSGRKRRAVSEPVEPKALPSLRSPPRVSPVAERQQDGATAPLFNYIPRRRRTESFVRSTTRPAAAADASTASPIQQGSSDHRMLNAEASLQTSHKLAHHTAQSRDERWEASFQDGGLAAEGEGVANAPLAVPGSTGAATRVSLGKTGREVDGSAGAHAAAEETQVSTQGHQQSSGKQEAGAASSAQPPAQQRARGSKHSRREMAELIQLSSFPMAMMGQQPFMQVMPTAMMMGQAGGRPVMMMGQQPFFPYMSSPGGMMATATVGGKGASGGSEHAKCSAATAAAAQAAGGFMMRGMPAGMTGIPAGAAGMPMMIVPGGMGAISAGGGMVQMPMMQMPGMAGGMMQMPMVQMNPLAMAMMQSALQSGGSTKA